MLGLSAEAGARYVQIGGLSSLRPAPNTPRFVEGDIPEQYRDEALEGEATRVLLVERAPDELDWLFVSPAGTYGAFAPGERRGTYRVGGEVALFDQEGGSNVSGADFALAVVDEIEALTSTVLTSASPTNTWRTYGLARVSGDRRSSASRRRTRQARAAGMVLGRGPSLEGAILATTPSKNGLSWMLAYNV